LVTDPQLAGRVGHVKGGEEMTALAVLKGIRLMAETCPLETT
jgi:hypothetical protein